MPRNYAIRNMASIDAQRYIDGMKDANDVLAILDMVNIAVCRQKSGTKLACHHSKNNQKKYIDRVTMFCDSVRVLLAEADEFKRCE